MNKNTSSDSNCNTELQTQEQKKNSIEIEGSKKSFLSYLLNKYNQDKSEDKGEFSQKFNEFMQKENCAVGETHELALREIISTFGNTNTDMIVFDNKKFRYLIKDKYRIWDIIGFILNKRDC